MTEGEVDLAPPLRRHAKFLIISLTVAATAYVGIHGAIRGWELQRRLICTSNIKSLGTSAKIYFASGWDGATPALDWLVRNEPATAQQIKCPSATQPNYVIVLPSGPPGSDPIDNQSIIAYEPKSNHGGEGGNVLFADGHASFVRIPTYDEMIDAIPPHCRRISLAP